ncbi:autorepressor SdpR family transcription factor [soil metagenome]
MSEVLKALSDPTRRQILIMLRKRSMSAGDIAARFELTKPTLSKHFSVLKDADLIYGERDGTTINYHLNVTVLEEAMLGLIQVLNLDLERLPSWKPKRKNST